MNRAEWEDQIKASNMNPTARWIATVVGQFGNYKQSQPVEPGVSRVAQDTGYGRDTVDAYMAAMVEQGWLRPLGTGKYNTTIYELCETDSPVTGLLAKKKKKQTESQLQNLSATKTAVATAKVEAFRQQQLQNPSATKNELVAETNPSQLQNPPGLVAETNPLSCRAVPHEPNKQPIEPEIQPLGETDPSGPVDESPFSNEIKEDDEFSCLRDTVADAPVDSFNPLNFKEVETSDGFTYLLTTSTPKPQGAIKRVDHVSKYTSDGWLFGTIAHAKKHEINKHSNLAGADW